MVQVYIIQIKHNGRVKQGNKQQLCNSGSHRHLHKHAESKLTTGKDVEMDMQTERQEERKRERQTGIHMKRDIHLDMDM